MDKVKVKKAEPKDIDEMISLVINSFIMTFGHLYNKTDLKKYTDENFNHHKFNSWINDINYNVIIAELIDTNKIVGFCVAGQFNYNNLITDTNCVSITIHFDDVEQYHNMNIISGEIMKMYVDKSVYGSGIASELIKENIKFLNNKYDDIYVVAYSENYRAIKFYEKHGFRIIGNYIYNDCTKTKEYIMIKNIR